MTVTVADLGNLGATGWGGTLSNSAYGINSAGQVVGASGTSISLQGAAFLWQNGSMTAIGTVGWVTSSGGWSSLDSSEAQGINTAGQVVGWSSVASDGGNQAVLWQNGTATVLASLGGINDSAYAINDRGQIVGQSNGHAALWANGTVTDLTGASAKSTYSTAYAINNAGQVVGSTDTGPTMHATLWQNGTTTDLGTLGFGTSEAKGINNEGHVVGDSGNEAFLWENGKMTALGGSMGSSYAEAINDSDVVVGKVQMSYSYPYTYDAALWENGTFVDLNSLLPANSGWVLSDATAINDNGLIVGSGTHNGATAAFVLSLNGWVASVTASSAVQLFQSGMLAGHAAVTDSAANVTASLNGLQSLAAAGDLSTITLTDAGTPTLSVTATQLSQDVSVLGDISGSYALSVTGVSAPIAAYLANEDPARHLGGANYAMDIAGIGGQSGVNSVIGFQSATLPTAAKNTVVLSGTESQYSLAVDASGGLTLTANATTADATAGQTVHVGNASYVVFDGAATSNGAYQQMTILAANAGDATVATLYQSSFGRLPDLPGLEAWQHQLDSGAMTLSQISQAFATSAEFQSRYGSNTTDLQFVDALYSNVLGRNADQSGEAAWVTYLGQQTAANGATVARATVLQDFASSNEEVTNSASWLITVGATAHAIQAAAVPADLAHMVANLVGIAPVSLSEGHVV